MNPYLKEFIEEKFKKPGKALDLEAGDFLTLPVLSNWVGNAKEWT